MKKFKKMMAIVLSLAVVLAFSVPVMVFAEDPDPSITIQNTNTNISINGKEYSAYKLFDSKHSGTNYSYTMAKDSQFYDASLLAETAPTGDTLPALLRTYFDFKAIASDSTKVTVTPKDDFNEAKAREFADKMQKFLSGKTATKTATASGEKAVIDLTAANAGLGYYIVTGSATPTNDTENIITAVMLTNENPSPVVQPKADAPSVDKEITKIANGTEKVESDGKTGNGSVGDKVEYELTSKVPDMTGYNSYQFIYTDTMSKGLTFNDDIAITIDGTAYTDFTKEATTDATTSITTIKITFNNFISQKDNAGKDIVIKYSATINEKAVETGKEDNTVTLKYSTNPYDEKAGTPDEVLGETPESKTEVYDTNIKLTKVDSEKNKLTGAKFKIEGNSSKVNIINSEIYKEDATNGTWYRLKDGTYTETAPTDATADQYDGTTKYAKVNEIDKVKAADTYVAEGWVKSDSTLSFNGLGEGTYTITEIEAPEGYNPLPSPITVVVTFNAETKKFEATVSGEAAAVKDNVIEFDVVNQTGAELPSTGGIGTTIFYVLGALLVVGAGVLLVTRRRMKTN